MSGERYGSPESLVLKSCSFVVEEINLSNLFTPRYSYNTAKGGVKHESINQSNPFTYMYIYCLL